jgi:colanic acid/amylovoran biosynthesis glycosyltransferase
MNILHLTHSFLPVTENWIYSQLVFNTSDTSSVLCQFRENGAQFPFNRVFARYARKTLWSDLLLKAALRKGRYSQSHTRTVIETVKPDLIHGHFAFVSCAYLDTLRKFGLPLVTTCYGLDISKLPRNIVWRKRYAELFAYGAGFIVEGPHMARCLAGLGCASGRIHCVPIGVDIEAFRGQPRARDPGTVRVLFTGLGREKKGGMYAASAFISVAKRHPEMRFDLIGGGRYLEPVRYMLERAGLADRCVFHGFVSVARYREILHSCDIVLAPSREAADGDTEGGAPVTVIEAQAAGIPVVGTLHCDIPLVVKNNETGLLCAEKNLAELSSNLEKLAVDGDLRRKMGTAASVHAAEQHDIRRQVEKISEIYRSTLESGKVGKRES